MIGKCLYPHFISLQPLATRAEARNLIQALSTIGKERYRCGSVEKGVKKPCSWNTAITDCSQINEELLSFLRETWTRQLTAEVFTSGTATERHGRTYILATDASNSGWGVVLMDAETGEVIDMGEQAAPRGYRGTFPQHLTDAHIFYKEMFRDAGRLRSRLRLF